MMVRHVLEVFVERGKVYIWHFSSSSHTFKFYFRLFGTHKSTMLTQHLGMEFRKSGLFNFPFGDTLFLTCVS